MYYLLRSKKFERSYEKLKESGKFGTKAKKNLEEAIDFLLEGKNLSQNYRDHQLSGNMKMCRECHIQGDLLLVYEIRNKELVLVLIDLGSHSYLNL